MLEGIKFTIVYLSNYPFLQLSDISSMLSLQVFIVKYELRSNCAHKGLTVTGISFLKNVETGKINETNFRTLDNRQVKTSPWVKTSEYCESYGCISLSQLGNGAKLTGGKKQTNKKQNKRKHRI